MLFPDSVSNKAKQANEEMLSFSVDSVVSAAMNFYSPCSANRPEVFSGCDKRIWIEKSSLYSTKAPLISAYTDFLSHLMKQPHLYQTRLHCVSELFSNSFLSGKPTQCRRRALSQSGSSNHALLITKKCPRD